MAQSKTSNQTSAKAGATKAKKGAKQVARAEKNQTQVVAESAVDIPVGVVLSVTDRVGDIAEPFTSRSTAERKIRAYQAELRRTLKRSERRGTSARRKATTEAKKTRTRVEKEAKKRQRTVETTLKRNRDEVEQRVRRAVDEQASRAQELVDQVTDQIASLR